MMMLITGTARRLHDWRALQSTNRVLKQSEILFSGGFELNAGRHTSRYGAQRCAWCDFRLGVGRRERGDVEEDVSYGGAV